MSELRPEKVAEFLALDRELRALMAAGKSETDEADAVRDRMDAPWWELNYFERSEVRRRIGEAEQRGERQ